MSAFDDRLADLPLTVDSYELERLEQCVSSGFLRVSTLIRLRGGGHEGIGEDVSYDAADHDALQSAGAVQPLAGDWTLRSFCDQVERLDLWPRPASHDASVDYRLWAYESAALDLALRQSGAALHEALDRGVAPLTFVVSMRLGEPSTTDPLLSRLELYPELRFKLDPIDDWTPELIERIAGTGAVDSLDFKGHYSGSIVDTVPDWELYRRVIEAFPDAWLEDPHEALYDRLGPYADRITWDAPIHSIADIESRPWKPRMVNIKPSRLGPLRSLLAAYEHCADNGIGMYGGGQFELGVGRGQIQYLASIFHPDGPNDVAPSGYNVDDVPPGLPSSPLTVVPDAIGFRASSAVPPAARSG